MFSNRCMFSRWLVLDAAVKYDLLAVVYPSATMLSDGTTIVTSGEMNGDENDATIQEIHSPSTNSWSELSLAPFFFPYYPNVFLLSDGRIAVPADAETPIQSEVLDLNALTWTPVGGAVVDGGRSAECRSS